MWGKCENNSEKSEGYVKKNYIKYGRSFLYLGVYCCLKPKWG
jgi:hypothetical protein